MKITITSTKASLPKGDILIVPVFAKEKLPDMLSGRQLKDRLKEVGFKGEWGSAELLLSPEVSRHSFIGVLGLGQSTDEVSKQVEAVRRGMGKLVQEARRHLARDIVIVLHDSMNVSELVSGIVEAVYLSDYSFVAHTKRLKKQQSTRSLKTVTIIVPKASVEAAQLQVKQTEKVMKVVTIVRDLVNEPASHVAPKSLVEAAEKVAAASPAFSLTVLDRKAAEKEGMTAFLAVAKGSQEEPYVIHLKYVPQNLTKKIVLVGKGITFDSGGLSLKPADHMEDMKIDMAGAAAVLGALSAAAALKLPVEVHGIIATCENMPSGNAYRPGDVVTAKHGKTIEILNTDAEGRVTLADALGLAVEQKPDAIIDLATLTGACMVALGTTYAGLWSNNEELAKNLMGAAKATGEGLAHMPLPEEYRPLVVSRIADVRNTATSRYGGAITAALFLQEFVEDVPWAHLDIAGPAYMNTSPLSYYGHGATGYGVRTLINFLRELR